MGRPSHGIFGRWCVQYAKRSRWQGYPREAKSTKLEEEEDLLQEEKHWAKKTS